VSNNEELEPGEPTDCMLDDKLVVSGGSSG